MSKENNMSPEENQTKQDIKKENTDYRTQLRKKFEALISTLKLNEVQKTYMRDRWLDQMLWMDMKADDNQRPYNNLRRTALIIGAIVPALISLSLPEYITAISGFGWLEFGLKIVTIILSIIVAVSTAVEQFFNYGERWRHYRKTAELLKIEGWSFITLSDRYEHMKSHDQAFKTFAERSEMLIKTDVNAYIAQVVKETALVPTKNLGTAEEGKS
jgi:hypothetical protein